jgi:hypothetical protein
MEMEYGEMGNTDADKECNALFRKLDELKARGLWACVPVRFITQ